MPLTELAPSLIIPSSLSRSIISCSWAKASAYGMPNNNTLVDTTHRLLPVKLKADPAADATEDEADDAFARVDGGIISIRAAIRSRMVSWGSRSRSDAEEISESGDDVRRHTKDSLDQGYR